MAQPGEHTTSRPAHVVRLLAAGTRAASGLLLAFAAVHLAAVWTPLGQRAENALVVGYADQAWFFPAAQSWGPPPLTHDMETVAVGLGAIAAITAVRRSWRAGCTAVVSVLVTLAAAEALKTVVLGRPDLVGADHNLSEGSFPSGHAAIAAALALGLALVASERWRPHVTAAGAAWLATTAGAVQAMYWHRPSDVLGATLLACASHRAAHRFLNPGTRPGTPLGRSLAWALLLPAAIAALVASWREDSLVSTLVFAAAAWACAALVWSVVTRTGPVPSGRPSPALT
ncbi:phosphatase PAP2 family protein [Streptomyces sp. NPDC050504]|uniref:phosphatase PAP2 family protein n=1 Tax=Streptomyces sp. NPDC050504 TaxID=3365618 RepID=UPI0037B6DA7A